MTSQVFGEEAVSLLSKGKLATSNTLLAAIESVKDTGDEPYDPHRIPPRVDWARRHGKANRVGFPTVNIELGFNASSEVKNICPCCGKTQSLRKLGFSENTDKLYFLGVGLPLFFDYATFCFYSLVAMSIVYSIYTIFHNIAEGYCAKVEAESDPNYCGPWWESYHSTGNTDLTINTVEKILTVVAFLILFAMRVFFFRLARKKKSQLDSEMTTPADYTLMITGLPRSVTEREVRKHFENYKLPGQTRRASVYRVNFAYYISDFVKIARQKNESVKKLFKEKRRPVPNQGMIRLHERSIEILDQKLDVLKTKFTHLKHRRSEMFTGVCFVTFNWMADKENMYDAWKVNFLGRMSLKYLKCLQRCVKTENERFKGKSVIVKQPPEPGDILWENLGVPVSQTIRLRATSYLVVFVLLAMNFGILLGLKYFQLNYISELTPGFFQTSLSLVISLIVLAFDVLLGIVLRYLSSYEKYITLTQFNSSVAKRVAFATWLNTCVTIVAVNWIIEGSDMKNKMWRDNGLNSDAFFIMLLNVIVPPLSAFFNPSHAYRWYVQREIKNNAAKSNYTQAEANYWFEGPPIDIAQNYAFYTYTLMMCIFFMPVIPISLILGALGILTSYLMMKYLLYYRNTAPKATGYEICYEMYHFIDFVLIAFGCTFDYIYRGRVSYWSIGLLVFSIVHFIFGFHYFYKEMFSFSKNEIHHDESYDNYRAHFFSEYDRSNPVTQALAIVNFLRYLRKRNPQMAKEIGDIITNMEEKKAITEEGADKKSKQQTEAEGIKQGLDIYANQNLSLTKYGEITRGNEAVPSAGDNIANMKEKEFLPALVVNNILNNNDKQQFGALGKKQQKENSLKQLSKTILGEYVLKKFKSPDEKKNPEGDVAKILLKSINLMPIQEKVIDKKVEVDSDGEITETLIIEKTLQDPIEELKPSVAAPLMVHTDKKGGLSAIADLFKGITEDTKEEAKEVNDEPSSSSSSETSSDHDGAGLDLKKQFRPKTPPPAVISRYTNKDRSRLTDPRSRMRKSDLNKKPAPASDIGKGARKKLPRYNNRRRRPAANNLRPHDGVRRVNQLIRRYKNNNRPNQRGPIRIDRLKRPQGDRFKRPGYKSTILKDRRRRPDTKQMARSSTKKSVRFASSQSSRKSAVSNSSRYSNRSRGRRESLRSRDLRDSRRRRDNLRRSREMQRSVSRSREADYRRQPRSPGRRGDPRLSRSRDRRDEDGGYRRRSPNSSRENSRVSLSRSRGRREFEDSRLGRSRRSMPKSIYGDQVRRARERGGRNQQFWKDRLERSRQSRSSSRDRRDLGRSRERRPIRESLSRSRRSDLSRSQRSRSNGRGGRTRDYRDVGRALRDRFARDPRRERGRDYRDVGRALRDRGLRSPRDRGRGGRDYRDVGRTLRDRFARRPRRGSTFVDGSSNFGANRDDMESGFTSGDETSAMGMNELDAIEKGVRDTHFHRDEVERLKNQIFLSYLKKEFNLKYPSPWEPKSKKERTKMSKFMKTPPRRRLAPRSKNSRRPLNRPKEGQESLVSGSIEPREKREKNTPNFGWSLKEGQTYKEDLAVNQFSKPEGNLRQKKPGFENKTASLAASESNFGSKVNHLKPQKKLTGYFKEDSNSTGEKVGSSPFDSSYAHNQLYYLEDDPENFCDEDVKGNGSYYAPDAGKNKEGLIATGVLKVTKEEEFDGNENRRKLESEFRDAESYFKRMPVSYQHNLSNLSHKNGESYYRP